MKQKIYLGVVGLFLAFLLVPQQSVYAKEATLHAGAAGLLENAMNANVIPYKRQHSRRKPKPPKQGKRWKTGDIQTWVLQM